jgi:hypothetical protein
MKRCRGGKRGREKWGYRKREIRGKRDREKGIQKKGTEIFE